ncbi:acylneuraminate cytidylyltransferase family protein [Foetidibacter luteolus]|uniref:acylneuraminate cytidylyltransferase family protein n=1 Tax=Foetidibacter luteolus TaxID=2608880 RepID=UPI00129B8B6E|nr:acylneuraminate cytidylyltransferase family protein [Foetidibacter luteolus]
MFILGTICCRGGSKGVPGKNIRLLNNKPLIAYTIETAFGCKLLNDLIVSTDDEHIAAVAKQYKAHVPFMRPAELSTDSASKWHVFIHALEWYEKHNNVQVDYLVDMDVTVPLKTVADTEGAVNMALDNTETDVVITGYEPERNPYFNMMEVTPDGYAEIVKKPQIPIVTRQDAPVVYSLTPAAYVVKKAALYNYRHWSEAKCRVYPIARNRAIDIDSEMDFKLVEYFMTQQQYAEQ